jgi:hypothetical protein
MTELSTLSAMTTSSARALIIASRRRPYQRTKSPGTSVTRVGSNEGESPQAPPDSHHWTRVDHAFGSSDAKTIS